MNENTMNIGVLVLGFFSFLGVVMVSIIGYFLKSFHTEYKSDKSRTEIKETKIEEKLIKQNDAFADKIDQLIEKISDKINALPKGSDNLSQVMLQFEREALNRDQAQSKRIDDLGLRIQNNYARIEQVAERVHALINAQTGPNLKQQLSALKEKRTKERKDIEE